MADKDWIFFSFTSTDDFASTATNPVCLLISFENKQLNLGTSKKFEFSLFYVKLF